MEQMDSMSYLDLPTMLVLLAIAAGLPPPIMVRTDHGTVFFFIRIFFFACKRCWLGVEVDDACEVIRLNSVSYPKGK